MVVAQQQQALAGELRQSTHTAMSALRWVGLHPSLQQHEHRYSVTGKRETRKGAE
jgi:hypothetical protein